jgi:peptide/nickel transport system substrate-binding protein
MAGAGLALGASFATLKSRPAMAASRSMVVYALSSFPPNLNPWNHTGTAAGAVKLMLYRGLFGYNSKGELSGELAESWKLENDKTYVIRLRSNAKFHNGDHVTSQDVKYSLDAIKADGSGAYLQKDLSIIQSIETPDASTVRVTLKQPSATFPLLLASFNAPVISAKSTKDAPIGAGPFTMKAQEKGTSIEVEQFDGFYKQGKPQVKTVRFVVYADDNLRMAALESGVVDIIEYVPWGSFDKISGNPALKLLPMEGPLQYLQFNTARGPFADARVRQAVGFAVNREDLIAGAFSGRGKPLLGLPIPGGSIFGGDDPAASFNYDPDRAKALLKSAGFPNGFNANFLSTSQYTMHKDTAEIVQAYLAQVGITTKLNLPDWPTRVQMGVKGEYDIAVYGSSGDYNDPDSLTPFIGTTAPSAFSSHGFSSSRIDDLLTKGRSETDEKKRVPIYAELRKAFFEEAPLIGLMWRIQAYGTRADISGFTNLPGFLTFSSPYTIDDLVIG